MEERRREKRESIPYAVTVEDEIYGESLGTLADLSPSGLRISGEEPVEVCDERRLRLVLQEPIFGKKTINVTVVCVWSKKDDDKNLWQSGCRFSHVSQEDSSAILGLLLM